MAKDAAATCSHLDMAQGQNEVRSNRQQNSWLFKIIVKNIIHAHCGGINQSSTCMKDEKCTKRYPRQFLHGTETGDDGYLLYTRRIPEDGGFKVKIKVKIGSFNQEIKIGNRWLCHIVHYCLESFKVIITLSIAILSNRSNLCVTTLTKVANRRCLALEKMEEQLVSSDDVSAAMKQFGES